MFLGRVFVAQAVSATIAPAAVASTPSAPGVSPGGAILVGTVINLK